MGKKKRKLAVFQDDDTLNGVVEIKLKEGVEVEHLGVKVMLIGFLGMCGAI
jgi:hypothetical protein